MLAISLRLTPIKWAVFVWTTMLWVGFLTPEEVARLLNSVEFGLPPSISFSNLSLTPAFKLLFAFIGSTIGCLFLRQHISSACDFKGRKEERESFLKSEAKEQFITLMSDKAGMNKVYVPETGVSAIQCDYYEDILKELSTSNTLKILSIAAYESIGKGLEGSMFFGKIMRRPGLDVELIISDPNNGSLIKGRIKQIQQSCPTYTQKKLVAEIKKTVSSFKKLKKARDDQGSLAELSLSHFKWHPVFRLIILDSCIFMNTYEVECHGHESPMYRIDRADKNVKGSLSLYASYAAYFENIKENSTPVVM